MLGLMATSSKRAYAIPRSATPRAPAPVAGHCRRQTLKGRSGSASVGSPGCTRFCLSPPRSYDPTETDPDLPVSVQEFLLEVWISCDPLQSREH